MTEGESKGKDVKPGPLSLSWVWRVRLSLRAEGKKLSAEGRKLSAEGDRLWTESILEAHGNITMEWFAWNEKYESYCCRLETGEVFGFDPSGVKDG